MGHARHNLAASVDHEELVDDPTAIDYLLGDDRVGCLEGRARFSAVFPPHAAGKRMAKRIARRKNYLLVEITQLFAGHPLAH